MDLEGAAELLGRARQGLQTYRGLVSRILGSTPDEVKRTLQAMEGLTPEQIRRALEEFRSSHLEEIGVKTAAPAGVA